MAAKLYRANDFDDVQGDMVVAAYKISHSSDIKLHQAAVQLITSERDADTFGFVATYCKKHYASEAVIRRATFALPPTTTTTLPAPIVGIACTAAQEGQLATSAASVSLECLKKSADPAAGYAWNLKD